LRNMKARIFLLLVIVLVSGCVSTPFSRSYENSVRHFREDVLHFYDTISDAYFILGYEYYELSKEFEKKGDGERAAYYSDKANLYYNLSNDMKNAAAETRRFSGSK